MKIPKKCFEKILKIFGQKFGFYQFKTFSHKIDYPELTILPRKKIKEYAKSSKNNHTRKVMKILLDHLNTNATFIEQKRQEVT